MLQIRKHAAGFLAVLAVILITGGCFTKPVARPTGKVAIKTSLASLEAMNASALQAEAVLTNAKQVITAQLEVNNHFAEGLIEGVFVGTWSVQISVTDSKGTVILAGSGEVCVRESKTAQAEITLRPAKGILKVDVDLTGFSNTEEIRKAKVVLSPGDLAVSFEKDTDTGEFGTSLEVVPGSYDMKIELYTKTTHDYNMAYSDAYRQIAVRPGQTTVVNWFPKTGAVEVTGRMDTAPPAPENLTGSFAEGSFELCWDTVMPPEDDLAAYRLYCKQDELDKFTLLAEIAAAGVIGDEVSYVYTPETLSPGASFFFTVTAVDFSGMESYRSDTIEITAN